jgi:hypothetical protein
MLFSFSLNYRARARAAGRAAGRAAAAGVPNLASSGGGRASQSRIATAAV